MVWGDSCRLCGASPQEEVSSDKTKAIYISFDNLDTNIIAQQTVLVPLEGAPPLPEPPDYRPVIIRGFPFCTAFDSWGGLRCGFASEEKAAVHPRSAPPAPSKYSYTGRLNLYITRTKSGRDVPPLTYNLFRIPGGKILTLQEILDGCNVSEPLEGADRIYFKAGANRCLVLSNESDCTIMQAREILMKGRSYLIGLDSKVDITFEDEVSEMALQYREVKPNELRSYART